MEQLAGITGQTRKVFSATTARFLNLSFIPGKASFHRVEVQTPIEEEMISQPVSAATPTRREGRGTMSGTVRRAVRRASNNQVSLVGRVLRLDRNFLKDLGLDDSDDTSSLPDILNQDSPRNLSAAQEGTPFVLSGSFLDAQQVDFLIRATQAQLNARALLAPHVTVYDGEETEIAFAEEDRAVQFLVTPNISSDRKSVHLELDFELQDHIAGETYSFQTAAIVPDGGTLVFSPRKSGDIAGEETASALPTDLSHQAKNKNVLLVMVTPSIIRSPEREEASHEQL